MSERPATFDRDVMSAYAALRSRAMQLTRSPDQADDLAQETVAKAMEKWKQFQQGTNLQAWLFTILRNEHITRARKSSRLVEDPDDIIAKTVAVPAGQTFAVDLKITQKRMRMLPATMRRAIEAVAILGNDYERAAELLGVAVGTVKSRVSRGRDFLETGVAIEKEEEPPAPAPVINAGLGERVAALFRAGRWISQIAEEVGSAPREVMRMVVDMKVRRA